jgi:hypothetical protein
MASFEWEEPKDRSPFPNPPGWENGGIEAAGGGGTARTWYHKTEPLRVIYGPYNRTVQLEMWVDPRDGQGGYYETLKSEKARALSDSSLQQVAKRLMRTYRQYYSGGSGGFVFGESFGLGL